MKPLLILHQFYDQDSLGYKILLEHSQKVTAKAVRTAERVPHLCPDINFIREAAMLHDIGVFLTNAPDIGCYGDNPYICHGFLGREILERIGLSKHALVCERHTGTGLTAEDIAKNNLPVPIRDMIPVSIEEKIICYADKFFSKNPDDFKKEKSVDEVIAMLEPFGEDQVKTFQEWVDLFGEGNIS